MELFWIEPDPKALQCARKTAAARSLHLLASRPVRATFVTYYPLIWFCCTCFPDVYVV